MDNFLTIFGYRHFGHTFCRRSNNVISMLRMSSTLGGRCRRDIDGDRPIVGDSIDRILISEPPFCHGSNLNRTIRIECRYLL